MMTVLQGFFPRPGGRNGRDKEALLETWRKRVEQLKESRPIYQKILDFYQKVKEEQERIKIALRTESVPLKKDWKDLLAKEGFPLVQKQDFPLDIEACLDLFQSLCQIARGANPILSEQVKRIEDTMREGRLNLKELFVEPKDKKIEQIAKEFGFDQKVLLFLIQNSAQPSIEEGMRQVSKELGPDTWSKGICPICGSSPFLSLLSEEIGKRSLVCSFCGYQWRTERLFCPFCGNKEQASLHYLYGENEESYRIDFCEKCHQYIKTIDLRKKDVPDPSLEDLATLHLDMVARERGYQRPVPTLFFF